MLQTKNHVGLTRFWKDRTKISGQFYYPKNHLQKINKKYNNYKIDKFFATTWIFKISTGMTAGLRALREIPPTSTWPTNEVRNYFAKTRKRVLDKAGFFY